MSRSPEQVEELKRGEIIDIQGISLGKDLYNITAPFPINGDIFILGREESKDNAEDSKVVWIREEKNGTYVVDRTMPSIVGEDPSITWINGELVIGVVKVTWGKDGLATNWKTSFYRGRDLEELKKSSKKKSFAEGPNKMKDIRLVSLPNGNIGVFTRPDETKRIGYIELNSLEELNEKSISKATIINVKFSNDEWGGVNEVHVLDDGRLGVLGHVANKAKDKSLHYRAMTFIFNPETKEISEQHEIATSSDFPNGAAKKEDLEDVIFSGGLKLNGNGKATLYVGLRDKEAASIEIDAPF